MLLMLNGGMLKGQHKLKDQDKLFMKEPQEFKSVIV